jgi:hypothetical protein
MLQLLIDGAEDQVGDPAEDTPGRDDFHGWGRVNARLTLCGLDEEAPNITCPANAIAECTQTGGSPASDPPISAFLAGASATDDLDSDPDVSNDGPGFFPLGPTDVTFTASDVCDKDQSCVATLTVEDTTPPNLACPSDITVECNALGGVAADDPQIAAFLAAASATDVCDDTLGITDNAPLTFPVGDTLVTFSVVDDAGNGSACVATVTIADTTSPTISLDLDPDSLWPPNHKLVTVSASVDVQDVCDPAPGFVLASVTSNEPDDGRGDGSHPGDIQDAAFGTSDVSFRLRAERSGRGAGRVYTVTYTGIDASGNTADTVAAVTVAHDRR